MKTVFEAAQWVDIELSKLDLTFAFIGGLAVQVWGENRVTQDVDITILVPWGDEEKTVKRIVRVLPTRRDDAVEFALQTRVLLCETPNHIGIDIGIGGFQFEMEWVKRAKKVEIVPGIVLPIIGAEELIVMKALAARPRDLGDIRGVLIKQWNVLNWGQIENEIQGLQNLLEDYTVLPRFVEVKQEIELLLNQLDN